MRIDATISSKLFIAYGLLLGWFNCYGPYHICHRIHTHTHTRTHSNFVFFSIAASIRFEALIVLCCVVFFYIFST